MKRICIYPKDIQQITGKSERQCRNIINKIKVDLNKEKHQAVTFEEFYQYMGIQQTA
jgi:flagellin-specific chaperone FliS